MAIYVGLCVPPPTATILIVRHFARIVTPGFARKPCGNLSNNFLFDYSEVYAGERTEQSGHSA